MHDLELGEPGGVSAPRILRTTAEHPFWVHGKGWTPTGELASGDRIPGLAPRESVSVRSVSQTRRYAKLYNLRVADYHTYYVGQPSWGFAVWSHNRDCSGHVKILRRNMKAAGMRSAKYAGHIVPTGNWAHRGAIVEEQVRRMQEILNKAGIGLDHYRNGFFTRNSRHLGTHTNKFIEYAHGVLDGVAGDGRGAILGALDDIRKVIRSRRF